jgi:predicted MFS family arabinose efflux permease
VRFVARAFRLIWGGDVEPALRPVLVVGLAGSLAGSAGWTYLGIWAVEELGASGPQLGIGYLIGAVLAGISGYLGGHLSDHYGRRRLILAGWGLEAVYFPLFLLTGHNVLLGLGLLSLMGVAGSVIGAADQALVADLVPPERHEAGYAAVRVASNLGVTAGPPLGALLLLLGGWNALFIGVGVGSVLGFLIAYRLLPSRGAYSPEQPPERGSFGVIARDRPFLLFLVSGALAYFVYVAYEVVMGVTLVDSHDFSKTTWGLLLALNPLCVTLFQLRLTRRVERFPAAPKLALAMLLMGLPLLLLNVSVAIPLVALVIIVFVLGEMLWVPTSQSVIAGLAPPDVRGAYMGAFGSTAAMGFALAPFLGFQVRDSFGEDSMWLMFAAFSVIAAVLGAIAAIRVPARVEEPVEEPVPAAPLAPLP